MAERERERESKRKREELRDRRLHPPDPQSKSILAAVAADSILLDCIEVKLRPVEGEEGQRAVAVLDAHDVGVLLVVLRLLTEKNPIVFHGWATSPRWPTREPRLDPVNGLRETLRELRRLGFLEVNVTGDTASVSYGSRVNKIAHRWGIELAAP